MTVLEFRRLTAEFILDLVDDFARRRALQGNHPRPLGPVRVFLTARTWAGGAREVFPATAPPELVLVRNPSGFDLFFGELRWPGGARPRPLLLGQPPRKVHLPLAEGTYELRIENPYYQVQTVTVTLPRPLAPPPTPLFPGYAYPFPEGTTVLRGAVQAADGRGVEGATVQAGGATTYLTDKTGQWALVFPQASPPGSATVVYNVPNAPPRSVTLPLPAGRESSLAATALRGEVLDGGAAARGATVRVKGFGAVPVRADGAWTYVFGIDQSATRADVTAVLADGRQKAVTNNRVIPRTTTAVPSIRF